MHCYYCGEHGHTAAVCRHGDYIRCHQCSEYGHKSHTACVCLSTNRGYAKKSWPIVDLYKRCLAVMCARQQKHTYKWYNGLQQPIYKCLLGLIPVKHVLKMPIFTTSTIMYRLAYSGRQICPQQTATVLCIQSLRLLMRT